MFNLITFLLIFPYNASLIRNSNFSHKGSHGLHQDSFKLQTMTALIKSFCGGVQGGSFFKKSPTWPPEAKIDEY